MTGPNPMACWSSIPDARPTHIQGVTAVRIAEVRQLLRGKQLRRLYLGTVISDLGGQFGVVAIAFAVLHIGSPALLGVVLAARTLPAGALVLVGGYFADRVPRHVQMALADIVRAGAQTLTAFAVVADVSYSAVLVVGAQAAYGVAEAFFRPASLGLVPRLVERSALPTANALMGLTKNISRPAGPAIGGVVVALLGPSWALGIDAATFVVGAFLVSRIRVSVPRADKSDTEGRRERLRGVLTQDWLLAMLITSAIFQAAVLGPLLVAGPIVATDLGGSVVWGLLLGAVGLGSVLGSLLAGRLGPRRPLVAMSAAVAVTAVYPLTLSLGRPLVLLLGMAVIYGLGLAVVGNIYLTVLHQRIPDRFLGRVLGIDEVCSVAAVPVSQLIAGVVVAEYGTAWLFTVSALAAVVAASVLVLVPGSRRLTETTDQQTETR